MSTPYETKNSVDNVENLPCDVPTANLHAINLERLQNGEEEEASRLLRASICDGFLYLDLRGWGTEYDTFDVINDIYHLSEEFFSLEEDEKLVYDVDKATDRLGKMKLNGYKPIGRNFGGVSGQRDEFESYAIPKDGVLGLGDVKSFARPGVVDAHIEKLRKFMTAIQMASGIIYSSLPKTLRLDPAEGFEHFHRPGVSFPGLLRLLKYHSQPVSERGPPQTPHTDLGSLTFLFTRQAGLQVLPRGKQEWTYVAPKAGHAIINLGDGMSLLSNGLLQSCLHRVAPLPGAAFQTRYSFAYLQRAEDITPMTGLKSGLIPVHETKETVFTSGEWLQRKFGMLRGATHTSAEGWVLTSTEPRHTISS